MHDFLNDNVTPRGMKRACMVITGQSFLFGYLIASFNPCLATGDNDSGSDCFYGADTTCPEGSVYNDMNLTTIQASAVTGFTVLGALIGCLSVSRPTEVYGRRPVLVFNCFLFIIGAVLASCSHQRILLFLGRFISGLGVGVASTIPVVLLSEIASDETRGKVTTIHQFMITLGIFVSGVISYGLATYVQHGWQYIQAFSGVPAVLVLIFQHHLPESPKWLITQHLQSMEPASINRTSLSFNPLGHILAASVYSQHTNDADRQRSEYYDLAEATLRSLRRPRDDVSSELASMITAQQAGEREDRLKWKHVFSYRQGMWIGSGLILFQALTGINSVVFYSTTIFSLAGFRQSIVATACMGVVQLLVALLATYSIDKVGRKSLLVVGTLTMLVALLSISASLLLPATDLLQGILALIALLCYVSGFVLGLGAATWTVITEIIPTHVRVRAVSLFLAINWFGNLLISSLTLTAIDYLGGVRMHSMTHHEQEDAQKEGVAWLYLVFAGVTVVALLFVYYVVPETAGIDIEDVDHQRSFHKPLISDDLHESIRIAP